jgi:hypothetical protein
VLAKAGFDDVDDLFSVITKDLYTYTIIILRHDETLRDHGPARGRVGPHQLPD